MITTTATCKCGTSHTIQGCGERHNVLLKFAEQGWDWADYIVLCPKCAQARDAQNALDFQHNQLVELAAAADMLDARPAMSTWTAEQMRAAADDHANNPGDCLGECPAENEAIRLLSQAVA